MARAQGGQWQLLGQRAVDVRSQRVEVPLSSAAGRIGRIQLRVADHEVEVLSVALTFSNGERTSIPIGQVIPAGGRTLGIELPGPARVVRGAEIVYRTRGAQPREPPTIQVWGLIVGPLFVPPAAPPSDRRPPDAGAAVQPPDGGAGAESEPTDAGVDGA